MPSDDRTQQALEALAAPRQSFRSAVALAADQVEAILAAHRAPAGDSDTRAALELGAFASARLDVDRFASLFGGAAALDPLALTAMERAHATLADIAAAGDERFVVRVPTGGDLHAEVGRALAALGRAFGAARAVETARLGRRPAGEADGYADGFGFRRWNRAERQIAPPLVVEVEGGDLQAGGLAEFLDGTQKIVLVVLDAAPPAPLVRLITPRLFIAQVAEHAGLAPLAEAEGAGVVAWLPETAARFVHTPGEAPLGERIAVEHLPTETPRAQLGSLSAFQQAEELRQLQALVRPPSLDPSPRKQGEGGTAQDASGSAVPLPPLAGARSGGGGPQGPVGEGEPADRLAAWLLSQTDLAGT